MKSIMRIRLGLARPERHSFAAFVIFLVASLFSNTAFAQAWVELVGPSASTYQAPASYSLQVKSGAVGTGAKAEYLSELRLLRNNVVVSRLPNTTFTESGLSPGTYTYVIKATGSRNVNGDMIDRGLTSASYTITVSAPPAPVDGSEVTAVNGLPVSVNMKQVYPMTVTVKNTGNITWLPGQGYTLAMAPTDSGNSWWKFSEQQLGSTVAPGQSVNFSFSVTANDYPIELSMAFQMKKNGTRFGAASGERTINVTGPWNAAQFVDQSVPTKMDAGENYSVTIRMKNSGTIPWQSSSAYALGSYNPEDNGTWGLGRVVLPADIARSTTATFTFNVRAPMTAGTYNFQWRMVQDGVQWFGVPSTNVQVQVSAPPSMVTGNIDVDSTGGTLVRGWACSTYRNDSIDVHLYAGGPAGSGTFVASTKANLASEAGVASACKATGSNFRFSIPLTHAQRRQFADKAIYVHGISPIGNGNNLLSSSGTYKIVAPPQGNISASPSICSIPWGSTTCSTTLSYSITGGTGDLYVSAKSGGAETLIASGSSTSKVLNWITSAGHRFVLRSQGEAIATLEVNGVLAPRPAEVISTATIEYDELGRVIKQVDFAGSERYMAYDTQGNLIEDRDGDGVSTSMTYDALGRVASVKKGGASASSLTYDAGNAVSRYVDAKGLATSYVLNGFSDVTQQVSPDTGTISNTLVTGLLSKTTQADGSIINYHYDGAGRLVSAAADDEAYLYEYDTCLNGKGRICTATSVSSDTLFEYTKDGLVSKRTERVVTAQGVKDAVLTFGYDGAGRLIAITYPDGLRADYTYKDGRAASMSVAVGGVSKSIISTTSSNVAGRKTRLELGNGLIDARSYKGGVVLDGQQLTGQAGQFIAHAYAFSNGGRLATSDDQSYGYSAAGRLASVKRPGSESSLTYDANGNGSLTQQSISDTNIAFTMDAASNRLVSYKSTAYGNHDFLYDPRGNRVVDSASAGSVSYEFSDFGQLVSSTRSGSKALYGVNGFNQRISKSSGSDVTIFSYSEQNHLMSETKGSVVTDYLWFEGEVVGMVRSNQIYFIHSDRLGRPELVTDNAQVKKWSAQNYAYGRTVTSDGLAGLNLGFPGQYWDAELGLWYNGYRYYDATSGRYISSDPIGVKAGDSTYQYVDGDPVNKIDPLGLEGVGAWTFPAGPMRDSYIASQRGPTGPDFIQGSVSLFVVSGSLTLSRSGKIFVSGGIAKGYPNPVRGFGFSANAGSLFSTCNEETERSQKTDSLLTGLGYTVTGHDLIGGGVTYAPGSGAAVLYGFGAGWEVSPGSVGAQTGWRGPSW